MVNEVILSINDLNFITPFSLGGGPLVDTSANHVLDLYRRSQACLEANKPSSNSASPHYNMGK